MYVLRLKRALSYMKVHPGPSWVRVIHLLSQCHTKGAQSSAGRHDQNPFCANLLNEVLVRKEFLVRKASYT